MNTINVSQNGFMNNRSQKPGFILWGDCYKFGKGNSVGVIWLCFFKIM